MTHITLTGVLAGMPLCGCNKADAQQRGDEFSHLPYSHIDLFLARADLCPECLSEYNAAISEDLHCRNAL